MLVNYRKENMWPSGILMSRWLMIFYRDYNNPWFSKFFRNCISSFIRMWRSCTKNGREFSSKEIQQLRRRRSCTKSGSKLGQIRNTMYMYILTQDNFTIMNEASYSSKNYLWEVEHQLIFFSVSGIFYM